MGSMSFSVTRGSVPEEGGANYGRGDEDSQRQCIARAKMGRFEPNAFPFRPSSLRKLNCLWPFQLEAQLLNRTGFNALVWVPLPSRLCGCARSGFFGCCICGPQKVRGISDAHPIAEREGVLNGFCAKGCAGKPAFQRHRTFADHGLRMIKSLARQEDVWVSGS